jgi:CubicO group peptidase (beta-lactamase class C family)
MALLADLIAASVSFDCRRSLAPQGFAMLASALIMRSLQDLCPTFLRVAICALASLLLASNSAGQRDPLTGLQMSPAFRQAISDAAKKYKIPGIAAALIEHGRLRSIEVFGVRDLKSNAPVTVNTIFEAGSLGEPLYAYAVLRFASEGHFNPGEPLTTYLPLPYVRDLDPLSTSPATEPLYDPALAQVTAIRVMNHTSGFPDWVRNQHLRLQSAPGQKWSYSNEGYLYLQHATEHAAGETFDEFVSRSILRPAGMLRTRFTWQEAYAGEIATGYDRAGVPVQSHHYPRPVATATLYTTIQDYTRFVLSLLASAPSQQAHESAVSLMLNPTVSVDDPVPFSWGLGIALEKNGDDVFFLHRDNNPGFQSFVMASRKTGSGVVIFTNSGNGLAAVPEIIAATLGGNHPILQSNFLHSQ